MLQNILRMFIIFGIGFLSKAEAAGKVDVGAIYVNLQLINNGDKSQELDLYGARIDTSFQIVHGLLGKVAASYANGDGSDFVFLTTALGYYIPIQKCFILIPQGGLSYSHLNTKLDPFDLDEKFTSYTPFVGIEAVYKYSECINISGSVLYGFAQTKTEIESFPNTKGESKGPSYAIMAEYMLTKCASISLTWAYNLSMSREKHGIKGQGARLAFGYYF